MVALPMILIAVAFSGAGRYTYRHDVAARPAAIIAPWGDRITYTWDAADRRSVERYSNDTRASYRYDAADRVTRLAYVRSAGTTVSTFGYRYDNAGTRIGSDEFLEKPGSGTDAARPTWTYDATLRLTREERNGPGTTVTWDIAYGYDPASDRTLKRSKFPASAGEVRTTYHAVLFRPLARYASGRRSTTDGLLPASAIVPSLG